MRKIGFILVACCVLAGVVALWPRLPGAASDPLARADQYELLSIDPDRPEQASPDLFHGYQVLGTTTISDPGVRAQLTYALQSGVKSIFGTRNNCFTPRHGIRVRSGGITTDILICFECQQARVFIGEQSVADWTTDRSPQPTFDRVLHEAGVPFPESAH